MNNRFSLVAISLTLLWCSLLSAQNEEDRRGYFALEGGLNFASGFDFFGSSTDQGSLCDPLINPDPESRTLAGCPTQGTGWKSTFDGGIGIVSAFSIGRRIGTNDRYRIEIEYLFRESVIDQTASILSRTGVARDKLNDEIFRAEEHINSITSHNFFVNVSRDYYEKEGYTLFLALGAGLGITDVDNGRRWVRIHDWNLIETGQDLPNSEEVRRNLAGTTSVLHDSDRDTVAGIQVITGFRTEITPELFATLKARWVYFQTWEAKGGLDILRSHEVPGGYYTNREIDPVQFVAVSFGLHYAL